MPQRMISNILKNCFSNTFFFHAKSIKKLDLTHQWYSPRMYGRKIIFRYFQSVQISYQKLDFHGISRFSANMLSTNMLMLGFFVDSVKRKLKLTFCVPDLYIKSLILLMMKTSKKTTDSKKIQFLI
jgi:hypothetical protein